MTVAEENRPKTTSTDDVMDTSDETTSGGQDNGASGRTTGEATEEAGLSSDGVRDET
ncbi:hypothetical protein ABZ467_36475 [Streptomyces sp. NPDC005727]|uniref:hypothetical protein n=1 Tax=unclassified Streptomyces TaxID=2593676 RepID=UPI0033CA4210